MTHSLLSQMLGSYIAESRQTRNIKQAQLATILGYSRQFMRQVEAGEIAIPRPVLVKCIRHLDLEPEKLRMIFRLASEHEVSQLFEELDLTRAQETKANGRS